MPRNNEPVRDPRQNADAMGGPSFHPAVVETKTPKNNAMAPSVRVPLPDNDDEEQREMLFDGTVAMSQDLYEKTEITDATPEGGQLRAARRAN